MKKKNGRRSPVESWTISSDVQNVYVFLVDGTEGWIPVHAIGHIWLEDADRELIHWLGRLIVDNVCSRDDLLKILRNRPTDVCHAIETIIGEDMRYWNIKKKGE